jgi:hypothetical protein
LEEACKCRSAPSFTAVAGFLPGWKKPARSHYKPKYLVLKPDLTIFGAFHNGIYTKIYIFLNKVEQVLKPAIVQFYTNVHFIATYSIMLLLVTPSSIILQYDDIYKKLTD